MNRMNAKIMRTRRLWDDPVRWAVPISIGLMLVGCGVDEQINSSRQSVVTHNRLSSNRLSSNHLPSSHLASNQLSSGPLSSNRFNLTDTDLIETDGGRDVLTYLISCAIPDGITFVGTDSQGTQYEFFGALGIAPQWLDHPLNRAGKGWVSACLFARVNSNDVTIPISLRGPSSALTVDPEERANWTLEEGGFYGMYFTPPDQPINWIACRGRDAAQAHQADRDCAQPDPLNPGKTLCGFTFAGDCGAYSNPPPPTACSSFSPSGYYLDCANQPIFDPVEDDSDSDDPVDDCRSPIFRQVITTFVHP